MVAKNEKLKAIGKELDRAYEQSEKAYLYNLEVARYYQEQGITMGQYEKQCFWAAIIQSQNERIQLIPEWSMKGNSKRRPPETRCVSDGR